MIIDFYSPYILHSQILMYLRRILCVKKELYSKGKHGITEATERETEFKSEHGVTDAM